MIGQTERDDKGVEAQFMKKKILVLLVCSMLTLSTTVSADILDYEGTINAYKEDNKIPQTFEIDNGSGEKVTAVAKSDKVSVSAKATYYTFYAREKRKEACKSVSWYRCRESGRM